jgi:hypothetical protein
MDRLTVKLFLSEPFADVHPYGFHPKLAVRAVLFLGTGSLH